MRILATGVIQNDQIEFLTEQLAKQTNQSFTDYFIIDENPAKGIDKRRKRIAKLQNQLRSTVFAVSDLYDYVWQLEGDSELPDDTLDRLIRRLDEIPYQQLGYVSGIQIGRHGLYCIGAWHIHDDKHFSSVNHNLKGIVEVDATGLYCLLAPIESWLTGVASWNGERFGPDVNWGLSLQGKKYVDMDLHIGHKTKSGTIRVNNPSTCTAHFEYKDKWSYTTE